MTETRLATPFCFVFDGGEVPTFGYALHDGDVFYNGERLGRCLTANAPLAGGSPWILTVLRSTR